MAGGVVMDPREFASLVLACCPDEAVDILAAADGYAAWAVEHYSRPRAAVDEPVGKLGALAEGRKLLAHMELTGTGGEQ